MDTGYYLDVLQKSAGQLDKNLFGKKQLEVKCGIWMDSVVLKIQKKTWAINKPFESGIFFSIWISEKPISEGRLCYNIHALKLRELTGYSIKSREFADAFRFKFGPFERQWPNVSTDFGPQTLMEGWVTVDVNDFGKVVTELANGFLEIQHIIDELLEGRRRS